MSLAKVPSLCQGGPAQLADLLLLADQFIPQGLPQEIHHLLFHSGLGEVFNAFPKSVVKADGKPCLLFYLPEGGLPLCFPGLYMALGEGPVAAKAVPQEDQVILLAIFADHQGSAGFFPFHTLRSSFSRFCFP